MANKKKLTYVYDDSFEDIVEGLPTLKDQLTDNDILDEADLLVNKLFVQLVEGKKSGGTQFHPEYVRIMLHHMGIQGKSYSSLAFKLGVIVDTLYSWEKKHPLWKEGKALANQGRVSVIEDTLIDLADGTSKGNAAAAIFYAKNAAPDEFKDKREMEVSGGVTYIIDTGIPARQLPDIIEAEVREIAEAEIEEEEELL